jgi:fatty acid desaturase
MSVTATLAGERGSEYAGLSRQIRAARLLDRTPGHYAFRIAATLACFAACWLALLFVGNSWWALGPAAVLGLVSTQVAFLGHDGGHQQIAASRAGNTTVGLIVGNLLTGLSVGWWADKHNRHHANPNKEDHDPDIGGGVLAFTAIRAANRTGRLARLITANQAVLFFPLLTFEGLNLHAASARWLIRSPGAKLRRTELLLLAVHLLAYLGGVLLILSPVKALAFVAVHQAVFGLYMGCSFAPNHKGMPIIGAHDKLDYLRRQVTTSRNIRGGWIVDQLLGGLNYQIEHHLFPSMPRPHLRRARQLVREYCADQRISYTETGLFTAYAIALRYLHSLGEPLRTHQARRAEA